MRVADNGCRRREGEGKGACIFPKGDGARVGIDALLKSISASSKKRIYRKKGIRSRCAAINLDGLPVMQGKGGGRRETSFPRNTIKREKELRTCRNRWLATGDSVLIQKRKKGGGRHPTFDYTWLDEKKRKGKERRL